jgi:hypothetical protein
MISMLPGPGKILLSAKIVIIVLKTNFWAASNFLELLFVEIRLNSYIHFIEIVIYFEAHSADDQNTRKQFIFVNLEKYRKCYS